MQQLIEVYHGYVDPAEVVGVTSGTTDLGYEYVRLHLRKSGPQAWMDLQLADGDIMSEVVDKIVRDLNLRISSLQLDAKRSR